MTQEEIAQKSRISLKTVADTIRQLREAGIIKTRTGAIMFTPKFINNKTAQGEANMLVRYQEFAGEKKSEIIDFPAEDLPDANEI